MTINLPINAETERLARKFAEISGKSLTEVVHEAIAAQAVAAGVVSEPSPARRNRAELLARMIEITEGFRDLPVYDARSPDEILGYDQNGLPS